MRFQNIELTNFRCFENFNLDVGGESLLVIGPNSGGKSSLHTAIRRALRGGSVELREFRDQTLPVELIATVDGIPPAAQGPFADALRFTTNPPSLRVGLRAIWDDAELRVETVHGFPDAGWRPVTREGRAHLPVLGLGAWRDAARLVPVAGRHSLLQELIADLDLDQQLSAAVASITAASQQLAQAQPLQQLLGDLDDELARVLPSTGAGAFTLGIDVAEPRDILRQLQLEVVHRGPSTAVAAHSGGVTQASIFALALRLLAARPEALLLVDEPEVALHAHAQRALVTALRDTATQSVIATHSPAVLNNVDPRHITRLRRTTTGDTEPVRATGLTDDQARKLSRYATSLSAEAYFAETVILVEGYSDLLAVRVLASTLGIALDAAGVSVLSLEGGSLFVHYLGLLGPGGLQVNLRGLCDEDKLQEWINRLGAVGLPVHDRASYLAAGFQVCDPDLEGELVAALTEQEVEAAIDAEGALAEFQMYASQPSQAGMPNADIQLAFIKSDKIRWVPVIAAAVSPAGVPQPLVDVLANL
jgi:ABC-type Mn2+/Zn2+ transport system ATPase subunit